MSSVKPNDLLRQEAVKYEAGEGLGNSGLYYMMHKESRELLFDSRATRYCKTCTPDKEMVRAAIANL